MTEEAKDQKDLLQKALLKLASARAKIKALEKGGDKRIAIIGLAGRFPGAKNVDKYFENILGGVECYRKLTDQELLEAGVENDLLNSPNYVKVKGVVDDYDLFDAGFFNYSGKQAELMDPQIRLFLETAWEALEDAGYYREKEAGRVAVFAGSGSFSNHFSYLQSHFDFSHSFFDVYNLVTNNANDYLSTRISYQFNFTAPSITVQTACSTSLVAVIEGCIHLLARDSDMILAGGVSLSVPMNLGYYSEEGSILSPDGHCRPFDLEGKGVVPGNGVGIVVLKRYEDALRDKDSIYAIIEGFAVNNDGYNKVGYTAPSIEMQAAVIEEALTHAGVNPEQISLYEAHGTATVLGDPIEIAASKEAYRKYTSKKQYCALGSVKGNIGHLDNAAGIAGLIKAALAIQAKKIPPSINFKTPNPKLQLEASPFYVPTKAKDWEIKEGRRLAAVSSFGIGGTNAHVILSEPAPINEREGGPESPLNILTISAKTEEALGAYIERYLVYLDETKNSLSDIAYSSNVRRAHFHYRLAVIAKDTKEAAEKLRSRDFLKGESEKEKSVRVEFHPLNQGGYHVLPIRDKVIKIEIGPEAKWENLLPELSALYVAGAEVEWKNLHPAVPRKFVRIPCYPFQRRRYIMLKDAAVTELKGEAKESSYEAFKEAFMALLASVLRLESSDFKVKKTIFDLGIDSMLSVELAKNINQRFHLDINPTLFFEYTSLESFIEHLYKHFKLNIEGALKAPAVPISVKKIEQGEPKLQQDELSIESLWEHVLEEETPAMQISSKSPTRALLLSQEGLPDVEIAITGNGQPVLMLGGLMAPYQAWSNQVEALCKDYELILVNHPGCGRSGFDPSFLTIDTIISDLATILDSLHIQKPLPILAYSFGGTLAMQFCLAYPERVSALALISTTSNAMIVHEGFNKMMEEVKKASFVPDFMRDIKIEVLKELGPLLSNFNITSELSRIHVPSLVVVGEADQYMLPEYSKTISRQIPQAELKLITGAGHLLPWTHAKELNECILTFLSQVDNKKRKPG